MDINTIKQTLERDGIVVIPNVLNNEECVEMFNGMWDFFEHITSEWTEPIKRDEPNTWHLLKHLEPTNAMMYQGWNIGHAQHLWDIRTNINVVKIWADLWDVEPEDLLVSFDGVSWLPPFELAEPEIDLPENSNWFHLDQNISKTNFEGLQGWITAVDVEHGDATLIYYENSHLMTKELADNFGIRTKSDWYPLNKEEKDFFKSRCQIKEVTCPAGSMVIWDSRLVHCNKGPRLDRPKPNYRCINYICYMPKVYDTNVIYKKIEGFEMLQTSNHYANRPTFFSELTHSYRTKGYILEDLITPINPPEINELGYSLIGYT